MTVSTNTNKVAYSGDGATVAFDLGAGFIFFEASELRVNQRVDATGVSTLLTVTTQYTVAGGAGSTGTVTTTVAPAAGETLTIQRVMPLTQTSDLVNNDTQDAEVVEDMVDKNTLGLQQLEESLSRTLLSPVDESVDMEIPPAVDRRAKFLTFTDDADATPLALTASDALVPLNLLLEAMRQASDVPAADKLPYLTGVNDAEITDFTAFARTLLAAATAAASRVVLDTETSPTGSLKLPIGTTGERDGSPSAGYTRANTTLGRLEWYDGVGWADVGDSVIAPLVTTRGDIIRGDASGSPERLALGAADQVLVSDGTDIAWAESENTQITTRGDIIRGDASGSPERLALGSADQILVSDGTDIAWADRNIRRGTPQDTTSGTAFDFTGIPDWVTQITVIFQANSLSGTGDLLVQIGDSGGIETSAYQALTAFVSSTGQTHVTSTAGFIVYVSTASGLVHGSMTLYNQAGNTWVGSHAGTDFTTARALVGGGFKTLTDTLTQVRLTATAGTFDTGKVNIIYQ